MLGVAWPLVVGRLCIRIYESQDVFDTHFTLLALLHS
jgi:hypothetical protein